MCLSFYFHRRQTTTFSLRISYAPYMGTVYADELFVLNLAVNYFILLATAKLCALPLKRWRFGISAALGGLYSVLVLLPELGFLLNPIAKLSLALIMTLISFGRVKKLLRPFVAFLAVSAAFGGAVYATTLLIGGDPHSNLSVGVSMRVLILSFATCYLGLTLLFRRLARNQERQTFEVYITLFEKSVTFRALVDTGNELYDPVSGLPVMVCGPEALFPLMPSEIQKLPSTKGPELLAALDSHPQLRCRFRLVPYRTAGVALGLIPVFRPDSLLLNGKEKKDLLVGFSPTTLCDNGEFSAVL